MANPRRENRPDVTIDSIEYQVVPGEGGYQKQSQRALVGGQDLPAGGQTSRSDMRPVYQTSWTGGSRWENPLLGSMTIDSYLTSDGFDMVSTPGNLVATPDRTTPSGQINNNPFALARRPNLIYYFEAQQASLGLVTWNGSAFELLANDFGNNANAVPLAMCWDPVLSTVFALFHEIGVAAEVKFVTPDSAGGNIINVGGMEPGGNIFIHNGRLMVYNGIVLQEILDPLGTPSIVTVFDDGMGRDYLEGQVDNATDPVIPLWGSVLSVASAEGVWIVKNVMQGGLVTPFIYRIDRDSTGTDIATPVATLPPGTVALDIFVHLGSLIVSTSSDVTTIMQNDISAYGHAQTTFYHYTDDSLGTIGSALGPSPDETVYKFLGADVARLWIGGFERVWVYESVRGGLHPFFKANASAGGGSWGSMIRTIIDAKDVYQFGHDFGKFRALNVHLDEAGATDTHVVRSTYFDAGLPAEIKSIVAVTLMTDGIVENEVWTVMLSADDGAFGSALVFNTDGDKTVRKNLATPLSGTRFQYQLAYTASSDVSTPSNVKGILIWMVQGEFLVAWKLKLRATDSTNLGNKVIRGADQVTNLETLAANQAIVTFVDNYAVPPVTTKVRVQGVTLNKLNPNEGDADVVLVEHSNA